VALPANEERRLHIPAGNDCQAKTNPAKKPITLPGWRFKKKGLMFL
jgi:hypothetical protein